MKIDVLTLFPDMLRPMLSGSILGRAIDAGLIEVNLTDIRGYTTHRHRCTDDYPFGGGAGMVMYAQPIVDAVQALDPEHRARRIYLSPRGRTLTQRVVEELAQEDALLLLCGHYEGVDQRALDMCIDEELSIGDYGKYRFEQSKKEREFRKNQKVITVKEVRLSATIEDHDIDVKLKNAIKFLKDGNKVKATIRFRGRQITHSEIGRQVMTEFADRIKEYGTVDKAPQIEGRNMSMFISPKDAN